MPRGDKTGPEGFGSMTGRRMGYCFGTDIPGFMSYRGFRMNSGRGMGNGRGFHFGLRQGVGRQSVNSEDKNYSLQQALKKELNVLKTRIQFIESELKKFD